MYMSLPGQEVVRTELVTQPLVVPVLFSAMDKKQLELDSLQDCYEGIDELEGVIEVGEEEKQEQILVQRGRYNWLRQKGVACSELNRQQKQAIETTLAQKFVTLGFGYTASARALKKRGMKVVSSTYYNNLMTVIVRKTFRVLQAFLRNDCKQQLQSLSYLECNFIRSPMLQCAKWLIKNQLDTFYKFVLKTYNLKKVYVSEDQASRLYGQLMQGASKGHQVSYIIQNRPHKKFVGINVKDGFKIKFGPSTVVSTNKA